jgi:membrane dipeptidase
MQMRTDFVWVLLSMSLVLVVAGCVGCQLGDVAVCDNELWQRARQLSREYIIIDTHQDVPYRLSEKMTDISVRTGSGDFDYPRARDGGLDTVFMAIYIPSEYEEKGGGKALADDLIDITKALAVSHPDKFVIAESVADVRKQFGDERVSIAMGMENGTGIEGDFDNLRHFYNRGIRYVGLVHSRNNHICDSSYDQERKWGGLSPFGKELVGEMNRLGMIIDVSHTSDEAFYQIMELSETPVVATHSSCRRFTPGWERNMSDEMIKLLAQKGGVIQINFGSMFVNDKICKKYDARRKHTREYVKAHNLDDKAEAEYEEKYAKAHPIEYADITEVVRHIDHVAKLVGIEHVGLGSDFDGVGDALPEGLKDVSDYPNLIYELLKIGYTDDDIRKICSENFLGVWSQIEQAAEKSR